MKVGFIAGTGFEVIFPRGERKSAVTPFGRFEYLISWVDEIEVVVVPRHGFNHLRPPHKLASKAHVFALHEMGARRIIAASAVGTINKLRKPGDIVIPNQFIDLTKSRSSTYHDDAVHTDFTEPYCSLLRAALISSGHGLDISVHDGGVYACTEGPRYETPAEIEMIRRLGGDVVGSSGLPEAILAKELGICYALIALISNWAAGLQPRVVSHDILEAVWDHAGELRRLIPTAIRRICQTRRRKSCLSNSAEAKKLVQRIKKIPEWMANSFPAQ